MQGLFGICEFTPSTSYEPVKGMGLIYSYRENDSALYLSSAESIFNKKDIPCIIGGIITNLNEIKNSLEQDRISTIGLSDNEIIFIAYNHWGIDIVKHIRGMYSIAIYDKAFQKLFVIRDRAGVKPLYYYNDDKVFAFASKLSLLSSSAFYSKEIDRKSLSLYFRHRFIPAPYTIFKDIYKLEPGRCLEINIDTRKVRKTEYWNVYDYYTKGIKDTTEPEALKEIERLLLSSVDEYSGRDNTSGVVLTGGYDSSAAAALLQAQRNYKVKTFTVGMDDAGFNEAPYAKNVAEHIGTEHHEEYIGIKDMKDIFEAYSENYDEPFGDIISLPVMAYARLASKSVSSIISGEAADEIFGGYKYHHNNIKNYNSFASLPVSLKKPAGALVNSLLRFTRGGKSRRGKIGELSSLNRMESFRLRIEPVYFTNSEINSLLREPKTLHKTYFDEMEKLGNVKDPMNILLAVDYLSSFSDRNMMLITNASQAYGIFPREPFSDNRLVELTARLPYTLKYKNSCPKYLLKKIVHKYIPEHVIKRDIPPLSLPLSRWLNTFLKEYVLFYLDSERVEKAGILSPLYVKEIVDNYYNNGQVQPEKIWMLLTFQMWYETWMS